MSDTINAGRMLAQRGHSDTQVFEHCGYPTAPTGRQILLAEAATGWCIDHPFFTRS